MTANIWTNLGARGFRPKNNKPVISVTALRQALDRKDPLTPGEDLPDLEAHNGCRLTDHVPHDAGNLT
jgi:hypothetical protein